MDNRKWEAGASGMPPTAPAVPSDGYPTNGDPLSSIPPTLPGAYWFHQVGEEMRAVLAAAGLTPSASNNAQLLEAIQRLIDAQSGNYALDTGAANAYVIGINPAITAYVDGLTVRVKAVNANTGASTLNAGGGAVPLVNDVGAALVAGDIPAGGVFVAMYIASAAKFYITGLVPSQAMSQQGSNFELSTSDNSGARTITLKKGGWWFRDPTLGSGAWTYVSAPADLTLVLSSGSTLGTTNGAQSDILIRVVNDAGTLRLSAENIAGGMDTSEMGVISTTAEGGAGAADSATVIYSGIAVTSKTYRVAGIIRSTQAAAGIWATAPSFIQGVSGKEIITSKIITSAMVATTSGTAIDITGIPPWAKRISIILSEVSGSGTSSQMLQLGTASGVETSGYIGNVSWLTANVSSTSTPAASFQLVNGVAATDMHSGVIDLVNIGGATWVMRSSLARTASNIGFHFAGGRKVLSGTLDRIRLSTVGGADTFDAGSMTITWE